MDRPKLNNKYDTVIVDYTSDGRGVCRINSYPVFVPFCAKDDKLTITITKDKKSYFEGQIYEIGEKSAVRVNSVCEHFPLCGGCDLLHINYNEQLNLKKDVVKKSFRKIAKNDDVLINSIIGMDSPYNYRNKAIYNFQVINNKIVCGFFKKKSYDAIEIIDCKITHNKIQNIKNIIQDFCNEVSFLPQKLAIKYAFDTDELMVCLVIKENKFLHSDKLLEKLSGIDEIKSIIINFADKNSVNFGKKSTTIFGKDYINEKINDLYFKNYLTSFFQVNPTQTKKLYQKAIDLLELCKKDTLIDLYCGVGTISLLCADKVRNTIGIEIVDYAIKSAKENATSNGITNSEFVLSDAQNLLKYVKDTESQNLKIVVDPPRRGLEKSVIDSIVSLKPKAIAYISCDNGTLARDLKVFGEYGYKTNEATLVDMFCGTYHVESVCLITIN